MAEGLLKVFDSEIGSIVVCDANEEAIGYCKNRFNINKVKFVVNEVNEWEGVPFEFSDEEFSFVYSWDAMVHFSYKWLDFYIGEFYRITEQNGYVFIHHSNLASPDVEVAKGKSEQWNKNPGWRSLVSAADVKKIAESYGFSILEQFVFDWTLPNLDCVTVLCKGA